MNPPSKRAKSLQKKSSTKKQAPQKKVPQKEASQTKASPQKVLQQKASQKAPSQKLQGPASKSSGSAGPVAAKPIINTAPISRLDIFVFGEGGTGELGLGVKNAVNVKTPRLNVNLHAETVGVVDICAGGMHAVALTHDNQVLTWGINDNHALGRDTTWEGGIKRSRRRMELLQRKAVLISILPSLLRLLSRVISFHMAQNSSVLLREIVAHLP